MNLNESKQMLAEAERTGAVKIMIPVSELRYMLQIEEVIADTTAAHKTLEWYADTENYRIEENDNDPFDIKPEKVLYDNGDRARACLKGVTE